MGCVSSRPANYTAQRRAHHPIDFYDDDAQTFSPPSPPPLEEIIHIDVSKIVQGLNQIKAPHGMSPIVCLNKYAYPLYIASFLFNKQNDANIYLPVVAFSHNAKAKFIYFSTINFLTHAVIQNTETAAFIENSITWASDYKISTIKIYLYNLPKFVTTTLVSDIQGYGYTVDCGDDPPSSNYDIVFATSQNQDPQKLMELAHSGTSIFYFFMEPYTPPSPLMASVGLAFPQCNLTSQSKSIKNAKIEKLESYTIKKIIEEYNRVLTEEEADQKSLDNIVSKLRYYISEMNSTANEEEIMEIQAMSMDYLHKTNFRDGDLICRDMKQCMVAIILTELVPKIPPPLMEPAPALDLFPGQDEEESINVQMKFDMKQGFWFSTGLWLSAGKVGVIQSSARVIVQIGAHALCLLVKNGPWHRWPSVITSYVIEPNVPTEVGTQFGGPVFIISEREKPVALTAKGFCKYPLYTELDPDVWEETKESSVKWGEIQTRYVDINLRKSDMQSLVDIGEYSAALDALVGSIHEFEGISEDCRSRVVFDVDLPNDDEPAIEDVVFMHINNINDCLNPYNLSENFALMLIAIAQSLIIDVFLDPIVERSFAICAVKYSLLQNMSDVVLPNCLTKDAPKLLDPLWSIFLQYGNKPFGIALRQLATSNVEDEETAWKKFITLISTAADADLRKQLDHGTKPGSLSITSSERLHQFQIDDINL